MLDLSFSLRSTTQESARVVNTLLDTLGRRFPGQLKYSADTDTHVVGKAGFEAAQELVLGVQSSDVPEGSWVSLEMPQLVDSHGELSQILVNSKRVYSFDPERLDRISRHRQHEIRNGLDQFL